MVFTVYKRYIYNTVGALVPQPSPYSVLFPIAPAHVTSHFTHLWHAPWVPLFHWTAYWTPRAPRPAIAEPLSLLRLDMPSPWLAPVCLPHMVNHFPLDMPGCMWPHGTNITLSLGSHSLSSQLDYALVIMFILSARQTHQRCTHCLVCHVYASSWLYAMVHSSLWQITLYLRLISYPSSI